MLRKIIVVAAALLLAAGCDKPSDKDKNIIHMTMPRVNTNAKPMPGDTMYAPPPPFVPPPDIVFSDSAPSGSAISPFTRRANVLFSLNHTLALMMAHDAVAARFALARDACLKDKALRCVLVSASISATDTVTAQLHVALPHETVVAFEKRLMNPLREDGGTTVDVTARATTTENQTEAAADLDRQLQQTKAFRDSLEELAKRPNLSVDEVLKIHEALTQAQDAVDSAEAAKRASDSKIVLEHMNIALAERPVVVATTAFDGFWQNAGDVIAASTAEMLLRLINALPWLPIALLLAWLAARFVKRLRIWRGG